MDCGRDIYCVGLDVHGLVLGHPEDQWIGMDCGRDIYCVGLDVHGLVLEDQWIGLDYTVLGWTSIDKRINIIINGYWSIIG